MRQIKFRVWDKYLKCFFEDIEFLSQGYWDQDGSPIFSVKCEEGDYSDCETNFEENFIFQQYTGLKDKNGREIYEGDLVKVGGLIDPLAVEWFDVGAWGCGVLCFAEFEDDVTVVGNIFENPELLK